MTIDKKIHETTDYDLFHQLQHNREIDPNHLATVRGMIEQKPDKIRLKPIIVNSSMEIVDGQYRFTSCKALGLPIYYVIDDNYEPSDVMTFSGAQKNWSVYDYIYSYAQQGNENYQKLHSFIKAHDMPLEGAMILTSKKFATNKSVRAGQFKFDNEPHAMKAVEIITTLHSVGYNKAKRSRCITGLHSLLNTKGFSTRHLISKIVSFPTKLYPCVSQEDYTNMFVKLYNHHTPENKQIEYKKNKKTKE